MSEKFGAATLSQRIDKGGYGNDDLVPDDYRDSIRQNPEWQKEIDNFLALLPKRIDLKSGVIDLNQATILDIGTGPGTMVERIKDNVGKVIALDRETNMTRDVNNRLAKFHENVSVVQGDFLQIPLADQSVDVAMSAGTVWHIPVERKNSNGQEMSPTEIENQYLSEALRVLKPGGVFIFDGLWNGDNEIVSEQFEKKRESEIKSLLGKTVPLVYRKFIFSSKNLEERLLTLGYKCQVEMPGCDKNQRNCNAKITLLENLNYSHET